MPKSNSKSSTFSSTISTISNSSNSTMNSNPFDQFKASKNNNRSKKVTSKSSSVARTTSSTSTSTSKSKIASKSNHKNSNNSGCEWLTTKKRGRDDVQIEHDRLSVLEERKLMRKRNKSRTIKKGGVSVSGTTSRSSSTTSTKKQKMNTKRQTKRYNYDDDDDDDDDIDSFIANSSSEEELEMEDDHESELEDEHEEDDEEDEEDFFDDDDDSNGDGEMMIDYGNDNDDDDGDRDGLESIEDVESSPEKSSSFPNKEKDKMTNAIQRSQNSNRNSTRNSSRSSRANRANDRAKAREQIITTAKSKRVRREISLLEDDNNHDDDDNDNDNDNSSMDELQILPTPQAPLSSTLVSSNKKVSSKSTNNKKVNGFLSSSDDDDDDILNPFGFKTKPSSLSSFKSKQKQSSSTTSTNTKSKYFTKDKKTSSSSSSSNQNNHDNTNRPTQSPEDDDAMDVISPLFSRKPKKMTTLHFTDDDDDDDDDGDNNNNAKNANTNVTKKKKKKMKKQILILNTDSENDDENNDNNDDYDDDEFNQDEQDEAIALSLAIEASKKDVSMKNTSSSSSSSSKKIIYKDDLEETKNDDEDDDDEENDNAEIDVYEAPPDEDELEASHVLDAANNLSAHIVSVLQTWCTNNNGNDVKLPKGIIVDGALSFGWIQKNQNNDNTNKNCYHEEEKKNEDDNNNNEKDDKYQESTTTIKPKGWITNDEMKVVCPDIILKDYQLIGVNWLALLHRLTFNVKSEKNKKGKKSNGGRNVNGVLADEMGLGKTVQTIAFLAWLKYTSSRNVCGQSRNVNDDDDDIEMESPTNYDYMKPHIIIVPASVLSNWEREFNKFCPNMNVVRYHGSMAERQEIKQKLREYLPKKKGSQKGLSQLDVVLTTFSYFSSEKSDDRNFLRKFDWNYMVVDEAHCLKNPKGARYRNMDRFDTQRRLLLTGTPIQNNAKELMSLLCFLMPLFTREASGFDDDDGNDGGARMLEHFVRIEVLKENKSGATKQITQDQAYIKLKQLLAPFVLRRRKDDVLPQWLPPKKRSIEWVPFDEKTRVVYESILSNHLASKSNSLKVQNHIFTSLRKAANHPLLLRTRHTEDETIEHLSKHLFMYGYFGEHETCTQTLVKKELENFSDYDIHCAAQTLIEENRFRSKELERYTLQENDLFCSPKFSRLRTLIPELITGGHRMLIFSQWTRCLDLLGCLMDFLGLSYLRLDGQTSINERQVLIDKFTNDSSIPVFLLSTRAGGMGINLTAADTCILHDLDFNPFNDTQAEDRCHRIGQKKPVTIIKMITRDTVDSDIYNMQERKSQMNEAILDTSNKNQKKNESKEMGHILNMAVSRYQQKSEM